MASDFDLLKSSFDQYIVRPLNAFGLGGFVFDVEGETVINSSADITDNYAEDNSALQDHIAIRPKLLTLRGYVGELVFNQNNKSPTFLQNVVQKLTILDSYLPRLSSAAAQAKKIFENGLSTDSLNSLTASSVANAADVYSTIKNLTPPTTKQAQAYMFFTALQEQKILVSVQTPYEYMTNMAIQSIIARQDEETKYITDFTITLKKIRTAQTKTVKFNAQNYQSKTQSQISSVLSGGKITGSPVTMATDAVNSVGSSISSALPGPLNPNNLPVIEVLPVSQKILSTDILDRADPTGFARKPLPTR